MSLASGNISIRLVALSVIVTTIVDLVSDGGSGELLWTGNLQNLNKRLLCMFEL